MFLAMAAGFTIAYYLGWLPPSFVVPVLFACSFLARTPRPGGRAPRRGGYVKPPASPTQNLVTMYTKLPTPPTAGSFSSNTAPGSVSADWLTQLRQAELNRHTGHGFYGDATADRGASGAPPPAAACGNGCQLEAGHEGPHAATFPFIEASPDWTDSPEQWAQFRAHPPTIIDPERKDAA